MCTHRIWCVTHSHGIHISSMKINASYRTYEWVMSHWAVCYDTRWWPRIWFVTDSHETCKYIYGYIYIYIYVHTYTHAEYGAWLILMVYMYIDIYMCTHMHTHNMVRDSFPWDRYIIHENKWVMSHIRTSRVTNRNEPCHTQVPNGVTLSALLVSCAYIHIRMSHFTHENALYHIYEWVMSHVQMSHVTRTNESCHTYEWVMSHVRITHVTRTNESCHTWP